MKNTYRLYHVENTTNTPLFMISKNNMIQKYDHSIHFHDIPVIKKCLIEQKFEDCFPIFNKEQYILISQFTEINEHTFIEFEI